MAIVTVSRQLGSWGDLIAERLADRLGVRRLDRGMMVAEVYRYGVSPREAFAPEMEERKPTLLQRLDEERRRYSVLLRAILYERAEEGEAVIIGLGSQVLLRNISHVLKTLVVAPLEVRVERVMEREGSDRATAHNLVRQSDRDRAGYMQYFHHVFWTDPTLYDLVINTGQLQIDTAVDFLAAAAKAPDFVPTPGSTQRLADLALASGVEAYLVTSPQVAVDALEVRASRGEVTISGLVFTEEEREAAEAIASQVRGVKSLRNDIRLKPLPSPFP